MPETSITFKQTSDNDIVLISSDQIRFIIPIGKLMNSKVFSDMLEVCGQSAQKEETIELTETAEVLEVILPYLYSNPVKEFKLEFPDCLSIISALHKYEIYRGLDAIRDAFRIALLEDKQSKTLSCQAYCFAKLVESSSLIKSAFEGASRNLLSHNDIVALDKLHTCNNSVNKDFVSELLKKKSRAGESYAQITLRHCACGVPKLWSKLNNNIIGSQGVQTFCSENKIQAFAACNKRAPDDGCGFYFEVACRKLIDALVEVEKEDNY